MLFARLDAERNQQHLNLNKHLNKCSNLLCSNENLVIRQNQNSGGLCVIWKWECAIAYNVCISSLDMNYLTVFIRNRFYGIISALDPSEIS